MSKVERTTPDGRQFIPKRRRNVRPEKVQVGKGKLQRLRILNDGREYYLQFLGSFAPQILLLTTIWLASTRFYFIFDITNLSPTLLFILLIVSFVVAVYSSWSRFHERCFSDLKKWILSQDKLFTRRNLKGRDRLFAMLKAVWHERFVEMAEYIVVLYFLPIALAIVLGQSLNSAATIWRANHPTKPTSSTDYRKEKPRQIES